MNLRHHPAPTRSRAPHRSDEAGLTVVLGALMMVGLLIITALVVDYGAVYSLRRRDQSGADVGALAAAQDLRDPSAAVTKAMAYAERSTGDLPDSAWNSCSPDAGSLAIPAVGFNCISFNGSRSQIRVRVPNQDYDTAFAGVAGVDTIVHGAFAIAGVRGVGFGGVLPFGMPAGAGSGDGYACVKSNAGGPSETPCDGPDSGNFGTLDFTHYGSESQGTNQSCGSGQARTDRIPNNIAVGVDHDLEVWSVGRGTQVDSNLCPTLTPLPNAAETETGNLSGVVGAGLLEGTNFSDGGPARLQREDPALFGGNGRRRSVRGHLVDDNGLWQFIPADLSGNVPASCHRDQFVDSSGTPGTLANVPQVVRQHLLGQPLQDRMIALLARCFTHYAGDAWVGGSATLGGDAGSLSPPEPPSGCSGPCSDPVFGVDSSEENPNLFDMQYTPRFAYVPEINGAFPSGSSQAVTFKAFRAVFIQRLVMGSGNNITRYDPGIASSALNPGGNGVREVTMWVFPPGMLPGRLDEPNAPYLIGVNRFVQLIR